MLLVAAMEFSAGVVADERVEPTNILTPAVDATADGTEYNERHKEFEARRFAEDAVINRGGPKAVEALCRRIEYSATPDDLMRLAEMGTTAESAVPIVVSALSDPYWESRVAAARALGFMGTEKCIEVLRELLVNEDDWRLVFVSVESLGRLKAKSAARDTEAVAAAHWFPPVREAARKALRVFSGKERYVAPRKMKNFRSEFFIYQWPWIDSQSGQPATLVPTFEPESGSLNNREIEAESFSGEVPGRTQLVCGLRIDRGLLLGADGGEWGGGLAFKDKDGKDHILNGENVVGIHRVAVGVIAAGGYAHVFENHGYLYLVDVDAEPIPTARIWKALPGAPIKTGKLSNGGLFVSCVGGDVVISPDGRIAMATEETVGRK